MKKCSNFLYVAILCIATFYGCSNSKQSANQVPIDKLVDKVWLTDNNYRDDMLKFSKDNKLINLNKKGISTYKIDGNKLIITDKNSQVETFRIDTITDNEFIITDLSKIGDEKAKFKLANTADIIIGDWKSMEGDKEVKFEFKRENKLSVTINGNR